MAEFSVGTVAMAGGGLTHGVPKRDSIAVIDKLSDLCEKSRIVVFNTRPPEVKDIVIKHHGGTAGRPILDLPYSL